MVRRTRLITFALLMIGLALLIGCATPAAPAPTTPTSAATTAVLPTAATTKYKEAPSLAQQVKEAKLPAVDQRLPVSPMVVKPDEIGTYGGTWRMGTIGGGDDPIFMRIFAYEPLLRWSKNWDKVEPNVAEKWEVNANATEYTIYLRKGMKWSDGEPFTADDIVFWYEDVVNNKDLSPTLPTWLMSGGKEGKLTKVDDYTIKFTFEQSFGVFEQFLAAVDAKGMTFYPAHWAKQFHAKYTSQAKLDEIVKAGGYPGWVQMFTAKVGKQSGGDGYAVILTPGRPTILPWMVQEPFTANATQIVLVRNPYYWKVDTQGQQYPYIDKLVYTIFQDVPAVLLKATNGEIDFQMRHFNTLANKPVLYDNQKKGDYHFFDLTDAANNKLVIQLNLTHKDKTMRSIFQNKDFRIGLSYAINRKEIIDTVYVGQGKPAQPAPLESTPFYSKQLATQYTEYDVAKANSYLDKVLPKKDGNGMRLTPDGKPFAFAIEIASANTAEVDAGNLIAKYWQAVGVNVQAKPEDRALMYQRKDNNDLDAEIWQGEGGGNPIMDPRYYFPFSNESAFAEAWQSWYNGGQIGASIAEEPPAEIKALMNKYEQVKSVPGFDAQVKAMNELLQMSADQFLCMGVMTPPDQFGIVKNSMHNVPQRMLLSWSYPTPAPLNTFTFFFK
jgi:peptide/nickel transport system substrate-binding protein